MNCELCYHGDNCYWCHKTCKFKSDACEAAFKYGKEVGAKLAEFRAEEKIKEMGKKIDDLGVQLSKAHIDRFR